MLKRVSITLSGLLAAMVLFIVMPSSALADYDCSDFSTQAEAKKWLLPGDPHRLDSDGDGVPCESLPVGSSGGGGGGGKATPPKPSCTRPGSLVKVELSRTKHRAVWRHVRKAVRKGWPRVMRINRDGADKRRRLALRGIPTRAGMDRDEYPMAMARKGWRASVAYVPLRQNRSAGAIVGNALRGFCDGTKVALVFR